MAGEQTLTRAQFAAEIKAKHPAYASVPDDELVTRMLDKFPVYRERIADAAPAAPVAQQPFRPPPAMGQTPWMRDWNEGLAAAGKNVLYQTGDLMRRATGMNRIIDQPDVQAAMTAPDTTAGRVGRFAGDAALFAAPLSKVAGAFKGAGILTRALAEGTAAAGVTGLQSGGDTEDMAMAAVGGAVLPFAGAALRAGGRAAVRGAAGAKEGGLGGALASAVRTVAPGEPRTLLIQALKPRSVKTNFPGALDKALPELKAAEAAIGRPIAGVDDLLDATKAAKQQIQQQLGILRGGVKGFEVDLTPVADAMAKAIPKKLQLENPEAALRLKAAADVYRGRFALDDAEVLLRETNAELDGFYAMYPQAQRSALTANPGAMQLDAQAKALRDSIYKTLDTDGGGAAARELQRRYGSLLDIEGEAYRRSNVAKRQQPESLSEQIGSVRAAADMARGTYKAFHGDLSGLADVAAAHAGRSTAKAIKDSQTTDALIRRAFEGYRGKSSPVPMPTRRPIAGLLERGPIVTPPPADASFVRGVPAMPSHSVRPALPPGQPPTAAPAPRRVFNMPGDVAPDASRVGSVPAVPIDYAVDPTVTVKAGGFRVKQFAGDPEAARAAVASPEVSAMLKRMADDLDTFAPQRGRLIEDPNDPGFSIYAHGGPGSAVGDDVRVISEQNVGNQQIQKAIADLLAGKQPTNRLHTAALDAAMGYLEKRPGYRGPVVPSFADEAVDDGFEAFSKAIDDVAKRGNRR